MVQVTQESAAILISVVVSITSSVCSLMNLILIKVMKKWNGYISIILHMCILQSMYDAVFPIRTATYGPAFQFTVTGIKFFSGISSTLWSNVLVLTILRVILTGKALDILQNYRWLFAVTMIPSLIFSILAIVFSLKYGNDFFVPFSYVYYSTRLVSIIINLIAFTIIYSHTIRTKNSKPSLFNRILFPNATLQLCNSTPQELAIDVLANRMFYYPLVQAMGRIGASIYEGMYGFDRYSGNTSDTQFALACFYYLTAPSIGMGYLIIFLIMQPKAYQHFKSLIFTCKPAVEVEPSIEHLSITRDNSFNQVYPSIADMRSSDRASHFNHMQFFYDMDEGSLVDMIELKGTPPRMSSITTVQPTSVRTSAAISPFHSNIQQDKIRKASIISDVGVEAETPRISSKQYRNSEHSEEHVVYVHGGITVELRDV